MTISEHKDFNVTDVKKLIVMTRFYLAETLKHLENDDPYDAVEKTWASVKYATRGLTLRFSGEDASRKGET